MNLQRAKRLVVKLERIGRYHLSYKLKQAIKGFEEGEIADYIVLKLIDKADAEFEEVGLSVR